MSRIIIIITIIIIIIINMDRDDSGGDICIYILFTINNKDEMENV
jgi:hypothetical protein